MAAIPAKVFSADSEYPPSSKDVLRVYSMRLCPYAQRTRMVLAHKNIPHEVVNINLQSKPKWFLEKCPLGTVPGLEMKEKIVYDSLICNEYLDQVYPQKKLIPADPYVKATHSMHLEHWSKMVALCYKGLKASEEEATAVLTEIKDKLSYLENVLQSKFFGGDDSVCMLDFNIWPHMERMLVLATLHSCELLPESSHPKLRAWVEAMMQTEAVKATYFPSDTHIDFYKSYLTGIANFDIGL